MTKVKKLFMPSEIDEFEKIIISQSNSFEKKNGFKEVIEPNRVKAFNYRDPVFNGMGTFKMNSVDKYFDDWIFTNKRGVEHTLEYKLSIRTFHDEINCDKASVEDYIVFSKKQFERYKQQPNKRILFERLVCNFDETTEVGANNVLAHKLAKRCGCYPKNKRPLQSWEYLFFETSQFGKWKKGVDYKEAPIKGDRKNVMYVVNKKSAPSRINLDDYLTRADNYGVLLSKNYGTVKTTIGKTLDELYWV